MSSDLAVSMLVAARDNGFRAKDQDRIVADTVGQYRRAMANFAGMKNLEVWYSHLDVEAAMQEFGSQFKPKMVKRAGKTVAKARTKDSMTAFSKLTEVVDGKARIVDQSPLIVPIEQLAQGRERDEMFEALRQLLRGYRETLEFDRRVLLEEFELIDFARKVVGVGSVGTRAWIALLLGRDGQDPLFLQMKEAEASVLEEFLGPSEFSNHGERVVVGQRLMQAASDIFLGWLHIESGLDGKPRDFYGRQLKDWKGSAEIEQMVPQAMATYGKLCGWTLARAHARSGDRIAIAAYLGNGDSFDRAIVEFSKSVRRTKRQRLSGSRRGSQIRQDHRQNGPLTEPLPQANSCRPDADGTPRRREDPRALPTRGSPVIPNTTNTSAGLPAAGPRGSPCWSRCRRVTHRDCPPRGAVLARRSQVSAETKGNSEAGCQTKGRWSAGSVHFVEELHAGTCPSATGASVARGTRSSPAWGNAPVDTAVISVAGAPPRLR